jgi:hypothetical protein
MITTTQLITFLPEFASYDTALLEAAILVTDAQDCGFQGIEQESRRLLAQALSAASWLISNPNRVSSLGTGTTASPLNNGQQVQEYKSYDDTIKFFENKSETSDGNPNEYQRRLNKIIEDDYTGGIATDNHIYDDVYFDLGYGRQYFRQ